MHVQVHYQGMNRSPWVDQFVYSRVNKLDRFLNPAAHVEVHVKHLKNQYVTALAIHNNSDFAFIANGDNLYESFAAAVDKATRALSEQKRKIKDKIHRKIMGPS
ncbi:MAG: HPF/RaiA family ribosome-associated protein [Bacteriovoracaceae bacterium]